MNEWAGNAVMLLARIVLSRPFLWACGALALVLGWTLSSRKRIPWLWRLSMVALALNFFAWPLIVHWLARYDLEMVWIIVFGAAALSFSWPVSLAVAANREPKGLLALVTNLAQQPTQPNAGPLEIPAEATVIGETIVAKAPTANEPSLSGNWRGRDSELEITLSLVERPGEVRGACIVTTAQRKSTFRATGPLESLGRIALELRAADEELRLTGQLEHEGEMSVRLEGEGFPAHELTLTKDA